MDNPVDTKFRASPQEVMREAQERLAANPYFLTRFYGWSALERLLKMQDFFDALGTA